MQERVSVERWRRKEMALMMTETCHLNSPQSGWQAGRVQGQCRQGLQSRGSGQGEGWEHSCTTYEGCWERRRNYRVLTSFWCVWIYLLFILIWEGNPTPSSERERCCRFKLNRCQKIYFVIEWQMVLYGNKGVHQIWY